MGRAVAETRTLRGWKDLRYPGSPERGSHHSLTPAPALPPCPFCSSSQMCSLLPHGLNMPAVSAIWFLLVLFPPHGISCLVDHPQEKSNTFPHPPLLPTAATHQLPARSPPQCTDMAFFSHVLFRSDGTLEFFLWKLNKFVESN